MFVQILFVRRDNKIDKFSGFIIYSLKGTEANVALQPRHFTAVDNIHIFRAQRQVRRAVTALAAVAAVKFEAWAHTNHFPKTYPRHLM